MRTTAGSVRGRFERGAVAFRGIPYAADPVGELRFAPPARHPGWSGVRDGIEAGPALPQGPSRLEHVMGKPAGRLDEAGGLNLNVWPPQSRDGELPVLFWVHGGGGSSGSSRPVWN
ncbi:MAG: carboxylesterase family protein [Candidatus Dormibacteraceae bacterium]